MGKVLLLKPRNPDRSPKRKVDNPMPDIIRHTKDEFERGINCAQVVLSLFAPELGVSDDLAKRIAAAFGGGLGRMGLTCGAVNGSCMALGLKFGSSDGTDEERKDALIRRVRTFHERFEKRFGSTRCRDLLGHDIADPEVFSHVADNGIFMRVCPEVVDGAVRILREILQEENRETLQ